MKAVVCELEFGAETLRLLFPDSVKLLAMSPDSPLPNPAAAIRQALMRPIETPSLRDLACRKKTACADPRAVIVVSDNTRPVPYRGPSGILRPIIETLRSAGVRRIEVLVATGMHRSLRPEELRAMLPDAVLDDAIVVTNHVATNMAQLRTIGRTARGTSALVNTRYLDADIKILTGLVEPHFMAGASGGPKSICPGLVGEQVTQVFHGAALMHDERCASLNCRDNPCHAESMAVAEMAGADFIVNVTLNGAKELTGVFAGDLRAAHGAAVDRVMTSNAIRIEREYDVVVTHAGFAGINHYQAAKAAVEAVKAVRPGGTLILAAHHTDTDPVGGSGYRRLLPMLRRDGPEECTRCFMDPAWKFVPEQWEIQMWGRAFRKLGAMDRLIYCAPRLTGDRFRQNQLPGRDGGAGLSSGVSDRDTAEAMVQRALDDYLRNHPAAAIAVLPDGPYGVPLPGSPPRP